jgi:alpha-L-rhamnosidase
MHRTIGGLAPATPGYEKMLVRPRPGGGLTHAATSHATPRGRAAVQWQLDGADLTVVATVPEGCSAVLDLPNTTQREVGPGTHTVTVDYPAADEKRPLAADSGG